MVNVLNYLTIFLLLVLISFSAIPTFSPEANASMILSIDDLGTAEVDVIIVDDFDGAIGTATTKGISNAIDGSLGDGIISYNGTVGVFSVVFSMGMSKPLNNPYTLDLTSLAVSGGAGILEFMLTDTDFIAPFNQGGLIGQLGGVTDGTVTYNGFFDNSNAEFGVGTPLITPIAGQNFGSGAFAGSFSAPVPTLSSPFSLTESLLIVHTGVGQITSVNAELLVVPEPIVVPEPTTMVLFGFGLIGVAGIFRRKQ